MAAPVNFDVAGRLAAAFVVVGVRGLLHRGANYINAFMYCRPSCIARARPDLPGLRKPTRRFTRRHHARLGSGTPAGDVSFHHFAQTTGLITCNRIWANLDQFPRRATRLEFPDRNHTSRRADALCFEYPAQFLAAIDHNRRESHISVIAWFRAPKRFRESYPFHDCFHSQRIVHRQEFTTFPW